MRGGTRGTSGGGVIAIAVIAFTIGRCSAAPSPAVQTTESMAPTPLLATESIEAVTSPSLAPPIDDTSPAPEPAYVAEELDRDVYYARCADARAAGAAPIHVGEPGYASHLDRDGDGVACE